MTKRWTFSLEARCLATVCLATLLGACATADDKAAKPAARADADASPPPTPLAPFVQPVPPGEIARPVSTTPVVLANGKIFTIAGKTIEQGFVVVEHGKIAQVGAGKAPAVAGAVVVELAGRAVTPGIIDTHSHMGVYPYPGGVGHQDGNEATSPATPEVWAEHSFWPQDPALPRAVSGGVTTIQVLPGSANLIGGRSFVAKLHRATSARAMRFPGAPQGLKMACGENPKRVYGGRGRAPSTRMSNIAETRALFQRAVEYRAREKKHARDFAHWQSRVSAAKSDDEKKKIGDPPEPPQKDFAMDTLVGVLDGKILVHNHCYRADEMEIMLDIADEFGFHIRSFHHALEAYKLRDRLAKMKTASSTWADWWSFKLESYDGIPYNAAMLHEAGAPVVIHSDSSTEVRRLNQEAAKAQQYGRSIGIEISDEDVLAWVTKNPAWALGVDDKVGTIEKGKMADLVVWSAHPLSVYARADVVIIDGEIEYRREQPQPPTDFEIFPRGER